MKLTTRGNYAISALIELARSGKPKHMSLSQIAGELALSENYLRQLFMELRKAGIVDSIRGVGGGYYIARDCSLITALDIVEAVEGKVNIVPCVATEDLEVCERIGICSVRDVWQLLNKNVEDGLIALTLKDLVSEYDQTKER